jgi:putative ubiquitin-RnfH superfamily antitoxin RatB of RatAB toxin-antitoxin module
MSEIILEVAIAWPARALRVEVAVPEETSLADAVEAAVAHSEPLAEALDQLERPLALGVFGKPMAGSAAVTAGDRVEIYRPLQRDPREARRLLASQGRDVTQSG